MSRSSYFFLPQIGRNYENHTISLLPLPFWNHVSMVNHYSDVIMGTIASEIASLTIVYSTIYSDADQRKHQSSASLAFVWGIHRGPVNSPHKWPVTRKMFPFDDVIMLTPIPLSFWKASVDSNHGNIYSTGCNLCMRCTRLLDDLFRNGTFYILFDILLCPRTIGYLKVTFKHGEYFLWTQTHSIPLPTLTHWRRVTHICVSKLTTIGLDNGLSPGGAKPLLEPMVEYCSLDMRQ